MRIERPEEWWLDRAHREPDTAMDAGSLESAEPVVGYPACWVLVPGKGRCRKAKGHDGEHAPVWYAGDGDKP